MRRAGLPLVTAQLVLRSGGEMDPPPLAGLADITANLLSKGAAGKTAPQIAAAAETLGGSLTAAAGWDESAVGITVTTPKLPQAWSLLRWPRWCASRISARTNSSARRHRRSMTCTWR